MTSTPHHLASMSSDEPRGYGAVGDARKRLEAQHQAHPDPAVRELMARVWDEAVEALAWAQKNGPESGALRYVADHNPYRSAP